MVARCPASIHRTAERISKQTDATVIAISQRRDVVSLYVDGAKYILEDIPIVLAKANQALATLDKYRSRLDQVSTRLTALEFEGGVTLHDVLTVLQRSELVTRMAVEIEGDGEPVLMVHGLGGTSNTFTPVSSVPITLDSNRIFFAARYRGWNNSAT